MAGARSAFFAGVRRQLPILLGVAPFGAIYGALAVGAGLAPTAAQAMSTIVFAGSSQFIAASLFGTGAPWVVIVLTTFVVNLRHALYSASLAPYVAHLPLRWKLPLAYLLTDEAYAVVIQHYRSGDNPALAHWFYAGGGLALWTTWQVSTAAGVFFGAHVPASWGLDFTLALTFIALLVPSLRDRPTLLAATVAAVVAILVGDLPYKLGLLLAAAAGIVAGVIGGRWGGAATPITEAQP